MRRVTHTRRRVLVCGGRDFDDRRLLFRTLDRMHNDFIISVIIHGDYHGADHLARDWARQREVGLAPYPAGWRRYGLRAGGIRNQLMLDDGKPALVVAFPGGDGTADMVRRARDAGVEVMEIQF